MTDDTTTIACQTVKDYLDTKPENQVVSCNDDQKCASLAIKDEIIQTDCSIGPYVSAEA